MRNEDISSRHNQAYQRLLVAGLVLTLLSGLGSMAQRNHLSTHSVGDLLAAAPRTPQPTQTATMTRLPGKDGSAASTTLTQVTVAVNGSSDVRALGRSLSAAQFGDGEWAALERLWTRESNWNPNARNRSGACGIPQALPCSKIHDMSPAGQITWGLSYIRARYGTPSKALQHWQSFRWY